MGPRPVRERRRGERRKTSDRRRTAERRTVAERRSAGDRRVALVPVDVDRRRHERRLGSPRRAGQRRLHRDRREGNRRREAPPRYSRTDLERIREIVSQSVRPATCPRCRQPLTLCAPVAHGRSAVREVRCSTCRLSAMVTVGPMARVMIIEDAAVRDSLRTILSNAGHDVIEPPDPGAALHMYADHPADAVMVNLTLPSFDGLEFVRQLQKQFPGARVIAIGARRRHGAPDPLAIATRIGNVKALRKPFTPAEMMKLLEETLVE